MVEGPETVGLELYQATQGQRNEACYLTRREEEVLRLVANGFNNTYIAEYLGLGNKSIENYMNSIYAKLGVNRSTEHHARVGAALMWQDATRRGAAFFLKPMSGGLALNFPADHPLSVAPDTTP